jgi:hypothetical protein
VVLWSREPCVSRQSGRIVELWCQQAMETAVAVDIRGYGASGMRRDIAYIGQLDDDMTDLVGELRKSHAAAK